MPANPTAAELLATVEASPRAVGLHDKASWVGLFAENASVEDPVGSRPNIGRAAIDRFYDTFIGPNGIVFDVEHDVVCGMTVFRDLTIATTMFSSDTATGVTLHVPMHLRYDLADTGDDVKIRALRAHWELPGMIAQLMGSGAQGLLAGAKLGPQLLGNQGVGGALGFMQGMRGVGAKGKQAAGRLLDAVGRADIAGARTTLVSVPRLEWANGDAMSLEDFTTRARGLRWSKPIAAGRHVTATVETREGRGIAQLDFSERGHRVEGVRIFVQPR
ncbi:nuclear transport factor 2 family protein [Nocardia huaxiensis]|uniref:Nuclear transport factor 2 family protein n=1 Tax=Nocardia huaxiensis TaxID=2755382 RepID=A0A7D6VI84_9NOCA|nr:nuclear transport factor 2 family protein [Nocardia huaxiensis]QLY30616.1 nuclear transport factor 2 family protein [Nocardia huaxiensis]UFS95778.1 nuclear transport factor 2 family protein [Nocardia huaxiensis]